MTAIDHATGVVPRLDGELVLRRMDDLTEDSAVGHDAIALGELLQHLPVPVLLAPLGADEDEVEDGEEQEQLDHEDGRRVPALSRGEQSQRGIRSSVHGDSGASFVFKGPTPSDTARARRGTTL